MWDEGAIIECNPDRDNGYTPVDDIWDHTESNGNEYISSRIIEDEGNKEFFERVYPIGKLEKMVFGDKRQAQAAAAALHKAK